MIYFVNDLNQIKITWFKSFDLNQPNSVTIRDIRELGCARIYHESDFKRWLINDNDKFIK